MIFIGIDPGLTGGIAALDDDGIILMVDRMPVMPSPIAGRKMVDGRHLAAVLRGLRQSSELGTRALAAVEQVGAMPKQSPVSMFAFGQTYGTALGVLGALNVPHQFVQPQKWQKHHSLSADKAQTLGWAMRRWPHLELKKSHDGMADALAIADWLRAGYVKS